MRSAADLFLSMFGIEGRSIRPAKMEPLLMGMLHTLATHGLIEETLTNCRQLTTLDVVSMKELDTLRPLVSSREAVGLYRDSKALRILFLLMPHIPLVNELEAVHVPISDLQKVINRSNKNHQYAELKRAILAINTLDLGYKVFQKPRVADMSEFYILKYTDAANIVDILAKHDLQMPQILDTVLC